MTIMPMAPMPAAVPATTAANVPADAGGSGLAGETFAALMAAQLGVQAMTTDADVADVADIAPDATAVDTGASAPVVDSETADTDPHGDAPVLPAGLVLPVAVIAPVQVTATPTGTTTTEAEDAVDVEPAAAAVRGRAPEPPEHPAAPGHAAPAHEHAVLGRPEAESAAPTTPATATTPGTPAPATPAGSAVPAPPAAPVTPVQGTASAVAAAPLSNPVLDQVKPTFTRLVSGPEGTHRMMLRLHPADLGEIHLTVRVTGDTVDVTVAARPEARAMLVDGHSELRGLLDSVGRTATQITFRDLPGTGTAVQVVQAGGQQGTTNPDGQSGAQHAATDQGFAGRSGDSGGNGHPADGAADQSPSSPRDGRPGAPGETRPPTTTRTAGHARGGLDVRM
jgi:hypothetical protein